MPRIADSSFAVVANGTENSPPARPLRDFLLAHGARSVTTVIHPLLAENGSNHWIVRFDQSGRARRRRVRLPSRPPLTYALDPLVPLDLEPVDLWLGLNNLAAGRGLVQRRRGRAGKVAYWAIDFAPDRFGANPLTWAYDAMDGWVARHADARWEVSQSALDARTDRLALDPATMAPGRVMPMGAWLARVPKAPEDGYRTRKVIFLGHLVERQGVGLLLEALRVLADRDVDFRAEIAGRGPLSEDLRARSARLGLSERVDFVGFVDDPDRLADFVASAAVAVAPYDTTVESFTRYADPSKVRAYMAGGLPVVLTPVPPNADELARDGSAELVPFEAEAMADAIARALEPEAWGRRRAAALHYMQRFDWDHLLSDALGHLGYES